MSDEQCEAIEEHTYIEEVIEIKAHCNPVDAERCVENLFAQTGLTVEEWSGSSIILALPGLSPLAAIVLAHAHGLRGGFPKILWLVSHHKDAGRFLLGDLFDLQRIRNKTRVERVT